MLKLPIELASPVVIDGQVASKVVLDLTVYLVGPSESELEYLLDLYDGFCPADRRSRYTIGELNFWPEIAHPVLTLSSRGAAAGTKRPYFEPVRQRIRAGRGFGLGVWDGHEIDDSDGSWSFVCHRIHLRSTGLHAVLRFMMPLESDLGILQRAAIAVAENVELYSGHGGLVFAYNPWLKEDAFDAIYAQSRRFWGIDVEDLNETLPLMKEHIKGVNWITLVGKKFASVDDVRGKLDELAATSNVTTEFHRHGAMLIAGQTPVVGDQHRPDRSLDPYCAIAKALQPLFLGEYPDFPGDRFIRNGNTVCWIRRFLDPDGWR